ncbi:hypothetical protein [Williamsia phyllosphaerae]|uniref:Uncharacterized protein n=1 Tax=Williamsia phyllosphaerae TaxID=885042 RepID=A0ABQ1V9V1_9NOCA|nr:hypothetical protein [Williamsia phyllosphaerae]GGF43928.1 hypothetical protein GCM10007298_44610 [Williamsia phyllosphaerae]
MSASIPVTARTEYLGVGHRVAAAVAVALLAVGLGALVILRALRVDSSLVVGVVAGAVVGSIAVAAVGRQLSRGAVILTVDDEWIYLGNEDVTIEEIAVARLRSVAPGGAVATSTSSMRGSSARRLTVKGCGYLQLEVARLDTAPDADEVVDRWQVAVMGSDPAAQEVAARLVALVPRRHIVVDTPTAASGPRIARVADAGTDDAAERLWEAATRMHDAVMSEYAPYELDTDLALRSPTVTDVTRPAVARFQEAMDAAEALRTDRFPDDRDYADRYQRSVFALREAWQRCLTDTAD